MKKILFFSLISIFVFLFGISAFAISEGDYIVAGEYNGQPLMWRCVSVSEEGIFVISDKVITKQAFSTTGNNNWGSSDARAYLNGEFLNSALAKESGYILSKNIKSIFTTDTNSSQHIYDNGFATSVQNADVAYSVTTNDKIFLPSITEIQPLYSNLSAFGSDFYMGKDDAGNYVDYFLRDALSFSGSSQVRCVASEMDIYYASSVYYDQLMRSASADCSDIGIRPAFYISLSTPLINGDGSISDPYIIPGSYYCEIRLTNNAEKHGWFMPEIAYAFSEEGQYIKYYCNRREYNIDEECFLDYGDNVLYAVIYNSDGTPIYSSEEEHVDGVEKVEGTALMFENFESGEPYYRYFPNGHSTLEGDSIGIKSLDDGNNVLEFNAHGASTFMNSAYYNKYRDVLIFETDIMLRDWNFTSRPVIYIAIYKDNTKNWLTPITIYPDGRMVFETKEQNVLVKDDVKLDTWYKLTVVYDVVNNRSSFYLDDELLVYDVQTKINFDYISYLNIAYASSGGNSVMYFDNIGIYDSKQRLDGSTYGKPYVSEKNIKTYDFTTSNTSFSKVYKDTENSYTEIIEIDDGHGMVGHMKTVGNDPKTSFSSPGRNVFSQSPQNGSGAMVFEYEFKVLEQGGANSLLGALSYKNADNVEKTWCVLYFTNDGKLYISKDIDHGGNNESTSVQVREYQINKWHKVKYVIDTEKMLIYVYFDGFLYAEVNCGISEFTGTNSRAFSVENSRKSCYLEMQATAPGAGKVNEIYIDNISHKHAASPSVYNLEYINDLEVIVKRSDITNTDLLELNFDVVKGNAQKLLCVATVLENNGELLCLATKEVVFGSSDKFVDVELELLDLPAGVSNGAYTVNVMLWDSETFEPIDKKIVLPK